MPDPQAAAADPRFDACLAVVLVQEGGYSDDPADPGGATNMGITRDTLARLAGNGSRLASALADQRRQDARAKPPKRRRSIGRCTGSAATPMSCRRGSIWRCSILP